MANESTADRATRIVLRDNEVEDRFELYVDGAPVGFLTYSIRDGDYALDHEEIDPAFQGQGMGAQLVTHALDQIRAKGLGVLPYCPFVQSFLQRHPEYQDLVPARQRAAFELPAS
jgi:predicted GNAT family acetyltransferase